MTVIHDRDLPYPVDFQLKRIDPGELAALQALISADGSVVVHPYPEFSDTDGGWFQAGDLGEPHVVNIDAAASVKELLWCHAELGAVLKNQDVPIWPFGQRTSTQLRDFTQSVCSEVGSCLVADFADVTDSLYRRDVRHEVLGHLEQGEFVLGTGALVRKLRRNVVDRRNDGDENAMWRYGAAKFAYKAYEEALAGIYNFLDVDAGIIDRMMLLETMEHVLFHLWKPEYQDSFYYLWSDLRTFGAYGLRGREHEAGFWVLFSGNDQIFDEVKKSGSDSLITTAKSILDGMQLAMDDPDEFSRRMLQRGGVMERVKQRYQEYAAKTIEAGEQYLASVK